MNGKGRRAKGSNFERLVAEKFTNKFNRNFRRTPLSGGFDKSMIQGDIFCPDKKFSLIVECKNHKTFHVPDWWKQVRDDTPRFKIPLLIMYFSGKHHSSKTYPFKQNQTGIMLLLRVKDFEKLMKKPLTNVLSYRETKMVMSKYLNDLVNKFYQAVTIKTDILTGKSESYILLTLETFFDSVYVSRCFKRIIAIKKIHN